MARRRGTGDRLVAGVGLTLSEHPTERRGALGHGRSCVRGDRVGRRRVIAVVPAAGRGTRLGALTATTPKALVPVAGRPVLAWVLRGLALAGASEIIVVVGHLGEQIEACVADLREEAAALA